jgi:hypothetical protein
LRLNIIVELENIEINGSNVNEILNKYTLNENLDLLASLFISVFLQQIDLCFFSIKLLGSRRSERHATFIILGYMPIALR